MALSKQIYVRINGENKAYKVAMVDYRNNEFAIEKDNQMFWYNFSDARSFHKERTDREDGEIFDTPEGKVKTEYCNEEFVCPKCFFHEHPCGLERFRIGDCFANMRLDGKDVRFVKVGEVK